MGAGVAGAAVVEEVNAVEGVIFEALRLGNGSVVFQETFLVDFVDWPLGNQEGKVRLRLEGVDLVEEFSPGALDGAAAGSGGGKGHLDGPGVYVGGGQTVVLGQFLFLLPPGLFLEVAEEDSVGNLAHREQHEQVLQLFVLEETGVVVASLDLVPLFSFVFGGDVQEGFDVDVLLVPPDPQQGSRLVKVPEELEGLVPQRHLLLRSKFELDFFVA